jgi:hypothetical protein
MCTVASAPAALRVRVWEVMSRGRGPRGRCPPPEGVDVACPRELNRKLTNPVSALSSLSNQFNNYKLENGPGGPQSVNERIEDRTGDEP